MKVEDRRIVEMEFTPIKFARTNESDNIDIQETSDSEKNDLEILNE
ncbi:hypothetical protein [Brachyspira hyodysenteriae]|nr:hypothetical protein [Brachyspira hyodysenteriae]MCZ9851573.1 hypothetical protein [Brachyspira hyodysenteriae]